MTQTFGQGVSIPRAVSRGGEPGEVLETRIKPRNIINMELGMSLHYYSKGLEQEKRVFYYTLKTYTVGDRGTTHCVVPLCSTQS